MMGCSNTSFTDPMTAAWSRPHGKATIAFLAPAPWLLHLRRERGEKSRRCQQ